MNIIRQKVNISGETKRLHTCYKIFQGTPHGQLRSNEIALFNILFAIYYNTTNLDITIKNKHNQDQIIFCSDENNLILYTILADIGYIQDSAISQISQHFNFDRVMPSGVEYITKKPNESILLAINLALTAKHIKSTRNIYLVLDNQTPNIDSAVAKLLKLAVQNLDNLIIVMNHDSTKKKNSTNKLLRTVAKLGCQLHNVDSGDVWAITDAILCNTTEQPKFICCLSNSKLANASQ